MRFCANVSMLFADAPFLGRFARAAAAGLRGVEFWWPAGEDPGAVADAVAAAGVEVALFNFDAGDMAAGDRGLLADPARIEQFRANVPVALELARRVGCPRLNALVGLARPAVAREEQLALAAEQVRWAAEQAAPDGIDVMIEPVNTMDNGPVLLHTTRQGLDFIAAVDRPNVRLQYDVFHMQRMEGDLVTTLTEHLNAIGHVQVADAPGRGEPGTGEINVPFVLRALDTLGYDGWVGLEYRPTTPTTEESLGWIRALEEA